MSDSVTTQQQTDGERAKPGTPEFNREQIARFERNNPSDAALLEAELTRLRPVVSAAVAWAEADEKLVPGPSSNVDWEAARQYDKASSALRAAVEKLNESAPPRDAGECREGE
jgi:cytochrome c556